MAELKTEAKHVTQIFPLIFLPGLNWIHAELPDDSAEPVRMALREKNFFTSLLHVLLVETGIRFLLSPAAREKDTLVVIAFNNMLLDNVKIWLNATLPAMLQNHLAAIGVPREDTRQLRNLADIIAAGLLNLCCVQAANGIDCNTAVVLLPHRGSKKMIIHFYLTAFQCSTGG